MMLSDVKLVLCPLNHIGYDNVSHTGLAVSAQNTAKVLRANGVNARVMTVRNAQDIQKIIDTVHPTHVVINALWLNTPDLETLVFNNVDVNFAVLIHSNIAFLQADVKGITLLREDVDLELSSVGNFKVAANSSLSQRGLEDAWEAPILFLPNLYFLDSTVRTDRRKWSGGTLRIGTFGAVRSLKNPTGAAFAALAIATNLGTNLEYHINTGRNDGGASSLVQAVREIFSNLPNAVLIEDHWCMWAGFRRLVRNMHLLLQPSFTESFNMVTADGVAEGVPSVVSDVIEWVPDWWKVSPDNVPEISRVGRMLLSDSRTGTDGLKALQEHNEDGVETWIEYLVS